MDRGAFVSRAAAEQTTFAELTHRFRSDFAPHHYRSKAWKHKLARLEARLGEYSLAASRLSAWVGTAMLGCRIETLASLQAIPLQELPAQR